jgi:branched-subunit amino acid transport protein
VKQDSRLTTEVDRLSNSAPRLGIHHLLYWTAGVALALWLKFGNEPPQPKNFLGVVLVASSNCYCIAAGGSMAFLVWVLLRRFSGKAITLSDPGSRLAVIFGITMLIAMVGTVAENRLSELADRSFDRWFTLWMTSSLVRELLIAAVLLLGLFWIGGFAWRIALACSLILSLFSVHDSLLLLDLLPSNTVLQASLADWLRDFLQYVPICAVTASLVTDWRRSVPRTWPHYFGVFLCAAMTIEFVLVQIVVAVLKR